MAVVGARLLTCSSPIAASPARTAAITQGTTAYFVTLQQLVDYLSEGTEPVSSKLRVFLRPKLLILDEVGYLAPEPGGDHLGLRAGLAAL